MHVGSIGLKHRVLVKDDTVAALGDVRLEHSFAGCVGCILNRELERDAGSWIFIIWNLQVQWFSPTPHSHREGPKDKFLSRLLLAERALFHLYCSFT